MHKRTHIVRKITNEIGSNVTAMTTMWANEKRRLVGQRGGGGSGRNTVDTRHTP